MAGIAHWHQLNAVANRAHNASRCQCRANHHDSTGGASNAQNSRQQVRQRGQALAVGQHEAAADERKRDQGRQAGQERLRGVAERRQSVGPPARDPCDAKEDAGRTSKTARSVAAFVHERTTRASETPALRGAGALSIRFRSDTAWPTQNIITGQSADDFTIARLRACQRRCVRAGPAPRPARTHPPGAWSRPPARTPPQGSNAR